MAGFWHKFADVAKLVGPPILMMTGVPPVVIPVVVHAINEAESIKGSGKDKKDHVMAIVKDSLDVANATGKAGVPTDVIMEAVSVGVDATVTSINAVKSARQKGDIDG